MEIIHIFSPRNDPNEGLWTLKYEGDSLDIFRKTWAEWSDVELMTQFCIDHHADIQHKFGYPIEPEDAAEELMNEADCLKSYLFDLGTKKIPGESLQNAFRPLNNSESNLTVLQLSKGTVEKRTFNNPKLRMYAVRVSDNTYVVTGAAIKLTDRMEERHHTKDQLSKMNRCRDWLKKEGICYPEDLNEI